MESATSFVNFYGYRYVFLYMATPNFITYIHLTGYEPSQAAVTSFHQHYNDTSLHSYLPLLCLCPFASSDHLRGGAEEGTSVAKCRYNVGGTSSLPLVRAHNLLDECR